MLCSVTLIWEPYRNHINAKCFTPVKSLISLHRHFTCHSKYKSWEISAAKCYQWCFGEMYTTSQAPKTKKDISLPSHSFLSIQVNIHTIIFCFLPLSSNQMLFIEICKDWTFLYVPWSVQAMKPLKSLKQTELMYCNYSPLLWLLWRYIAGTCECHLCWKPQTIFLSGSVGVSLLGFSWASEHV